MKTLSKLIQIRKEQDVLGSELKTLRQEIYQLQADQAQELKKYENTNVVQLRPNDDRFNYEMAKRLILMKQKSQKAQINIYQYNQLKKSKTFKVLVHTEKYGIHYIIGGFFFVSFLSFLAIL